MSVEKAIAAGIEPVAKATVALERRVEAVENLPSPLNGLDGRDADPIEVADILADKHADLLRGEKGDPGEPGPAGVRGDDGEDGDPGQPADPEIVAEILADKHVDILRGEKGEPGEPGLVGPAGENGVDGKDSDPDAVAEVLADKYFDLLRGEKGIPGDIGPAGPAGRDGEDGADADVEAVARVLAEKHAELLIGEQGEPGPMGPAGPSPDIAELALFLIETFPDELRGSAGKDADPTEIATIFAESFAEQLRGPQGEPGKDADPEEVAEAMVRGYGDILRGEKGEPGDKGLKGDPGRDADPELVAKVIITKHATRIRGDKGDQGDPGYGVNGLGVDTPMWEPGIHREGTVIQHDLGRFSRAMKDTSGEPGNSGDWVRIGKGGFRWCGVKRPDFAYEDGDFYIDDGTTFMFRGGKGHMMAKRGDKGKQGERGEQGPKGDPGLRLVESYLDEKGLVLVFDDGTVMETETRGLTVFLLETMKAALEAEYVQRELIDRERGAFTVRSFRGEFNVSLDYKAGDMVSLKRTLWLCSRDTSGTMRPADWLKMIGI